MATGDSDVSICSAALISLGASKITSLKDTDDVSVACNSLYPSLRDSMLSCYHWSWSIKKRQLTKTNIAPINEWKNSYRLPSDMLSGVLAVFNSSSSSQSPVRYGWEVYGDDLFTNLETVYIDYQASVPEYKMPSYFVKLLQLATAAELAIPITDQGSKADYFRAQAFGSPGENGRGGEMRKAMNIDGRGQATKIIEDFSLIQVRY
jgi:hypothetical protein|tara:strand:+ start:25 stop:642 length:618 start_codon:yes stop_codon:yes gene_type:complete